MKTLSVIVPFFNEEKTIPELVLQLDGLPNGVISECIFVNDGSTDSSSTLLLEALRNVSFEYQVINKPNGGKASAIKSATSLLRTTHSVILDADLELSAEDVTRMWEIVLEKKVDIVYGYRKFLSQSAFTYRYARGNQLISHIYGILYNEVITDIMCGLKLMPSEYFKSCPFRYSKFAVEVELPLNLWLKRLKPYEIQVSYTPRSREEGKVIGVKDALQIIFELCMFRIIMSRKRSL